MIYTVISMTYSNVGSSDYIYEIEAGDPRSEERLELGQTLRSIPMEGENIQEVDWMHCSSKLVGRMRDLGYDYPQDEGSTRHLAEFLKKNFKAR